MVDGVTGGEELSLLEQLIKVQSSIEQRRMINVLVSLYTVNIRYNQF